MIDEVRRTCSFPSLIVCMRSLRHWPWTGLAVLVFLFEGCDERTVLPVRGPDRLPLESFVSVELLSGMPSHVGLFRP